MHNLCVIKGHECCKGFSLIDLIVSVAILGILSSIAVANYKSYRTKAMVSGGKNHLAVLFKFEKIFFNEFNTYSARLDQLGFKVDGVSVFNIGFANDFNNVPVGAPSGSATCNYTCNSCIPSTCSPPALWTCGMPASNSLDASAGSVATNTTFSAQAHGHLDNAECSENSSTNIYTISVDQNGNWIVNPNGI